MLTGAFHVYLDGKGHIDPSLHVALKYVLGDCNQLMHDHMKAQV